MSSRFEQSRKDWSTSKDTLADEVLADHYGVDVSDIYSPESLVDDEHVVDPDEGYRVHQILDYGGVDKIVDASTHHIYVDQRFRPNVRGRRDFSLRTDNGVPDRPEKLAKWRNAHRGRGFYPSVIAFGVYDDVIECFSEFHLIDTETLLDCLDAGIVDGDRHWTNDGHGVEALYISVESLDTAGCIIESWDGVARDGGSNE